MQEVWLTRSAALSMPCKTVASSAFVCAKRAPEGVTPPWVQGQAAATQLQQTRARQAAVKKGLVKLRSQAQALHASVGAEGAILEGLQASTQQARADYEAAKAQQSELQVSCPNPAQGVGCRHSICMCGRRSTLWCTASRPVGIEHRSCITGQPLASQMVADLREHFACNQDPCLAPPRPPVTGP